MRKEQANDERGTAARVSPDGQTVEFRGQRFPLGKAKVRTTIPADGPNKTRAQRLRLEEMES
jgi:hypothetical protein